MLRNRSDLEKMRTEVCETNLTQMMDSIFVHLSITSIAGMRIEPVSCIHGFIQFVQRISY